MSNADVDILSDSIFIHPAEPNLDQSAIELQDAQEKEPTYILPPDIDPVKYTHALAEYILTLTPDGDHPDEEQQFIYHSHRLYRIVAENFVLASGTDDLTRENKWQSLFCHEARKPVAGIGLQLGLAERLPEQRFTRYENVRVGIEHFIETLDFRDKFEKLESIFTVSTEPADVVEIIRRTVARFYAEHDQSTRSVDFPIGIYGSVSEIGSVNVCALELIIGELLHNSYKYGNPSGDGLAIIVQPGQSQNDSPSKQRMSVLVRDFGPGVPDTSRLWQLNQRQTTEEEGSGIGLYFVRRAIVGIGGEISARNGTEEEGMGLHFELLLPAVTGKRLEQYYEKLRSLRVTESLSAMRNDPSLTDIEANT